MCVHAVRGDAKGLPTAQRPPATEPSGRDHSLASSCWLPRAGLEFPRPAPCVSTSPISQSRDLVSGLGCASPLGRAGFPNGITALARAGISQQTSNCQEMRLCSTLGTVRKFHHVIINADSLGPGLRSAGLILVHVIVSLVDLVNVVTIRCRQHPCEV